MSLEVDPTSISERLRREVVGSKRWDGADVPDIEAFDVSYYEPVRSIETQIRDDLVEGRRHIFEADLTERRRILGRRRMRQRRVSQLRGAVVELSWSS